MADLLKDAIREAVREALSELALPPQANAGPRLMRVSAVAEYMDCTPPHVHNLIARGKLKAIRWPLADGSEGRTVWIDRADVDRAIEEAKSDAA